MAVQRREASGWAREPTSSVERADRFRRDEGDIGPDVPHVGLFQALARHWFVALLPVLAFVALGATYAVTRPPVYTATSTLSVVQVDLSSPGALAGFPAASQALASAFSRAVDSDALTVPVAKKLNLNLGNVAGRTFATPVPQSPVIRVYATGGSPAQAVTLANTMSQELVTYASRLSTANPQGRRLLDDYRLASRGHERALAAQRRAQRAYDRNPSARNQAALIRAKSDTDTTQLKSDALRARYQQNQQALTSGSILRLLSPSRGASSDRRAKFQLAILIGLAAGLIVGAALASWRFHRVARRTALALRERS
jgi:capsular polysaccharide biosynthesis protein